MAIGVTEFVPVSKLPSHTRSEAQTPQPISDEDLFLVSENSQNDTTNEEYYVSKKLTYDDFKRSLSVSLGVGEWLPKNWVMDDRWIYGNNIICSDVDWPQEPKYDKNNPMFLWALKQTLSANVVSVMSHPAVSAMSDVFAGHEFDQISSVNGYFQNLYVGGEDIKAFHFKGRGIYISNTEISDITPGNPTYGQRVQAVGHQGWVYQVSPIGELSNLEYASNGTEWIQLGFDMSYASKNAYGIVKIGSGGIDVVDGTISSEDHIICSKKWYDNQVSSGNIDENTIYYLSDDNASEMSASSVTVGGVKIGYQNNANNFALELNDEARAYVQVPYATTLSTGVVIPGYGLSVGGNGILSLCASGVTPGVYGISSITQYDVNDSFIVPCISIDQTGRVISAYNSLTDFPTEIDRWRGTIKCQRWSRICQILADSISQKSNFIFTVAASRNGVAYSNVYAAAIDSNSKSSLTKLAGVGAIQVRLVVNSESVCYIEIFDDNSDSSVSQGITCAVAKTGCGKVIKYKGFVDGTVLPEDYVRGAALSCTSADIDAAVINAQDVVGYVKASDLSIAVDDVTIGRNSQNQICVKNIGSLSNDLTSTMAVRSELSSDQWNSSYEKTKDLSGQLSSVQMRFYVDGQVDPITYDVVIKL